MRWLGPVGRWARSVRPEPAHLRGEVLRGLPGAMAAVPDGMAASVLVGVNPVYGLYASAVGPVAGGLASSTRLMVVTTTSAAALAAGSALSGAAEADRPGSLFLLTVLAGAVMIAAGVARLGRYTRFVSHSVMMGFLTGVAVNIIAGQVPDLTGASASGSVNLAKAFDVLLHPSGIDQASLAAGLAALALVALLDRTRLAIVGAVAALVLPTLAVILLDATSVARVEDLGAIPAGIPLPELPQLRHLTVNLVAGAFAIAAIVLVQGAGVAESAPNPGGDRSEPDRDFVAQGVGNLAAGLFRGQPVGGSVGRTSLNVAAGARSRWAGICSGLWLVVILAALSGVVGQVAVPTLAAVLIYAAFRSLRPGQVATILRTGPTSQVALVTTFTATLVLPVAAAVGIGVALSLLLQLNQEALDLAVVQRRALADGRVEEGPGPKALPSHEVTVLDVYGSLFYAGARTLQAKLPDPTASRGAAVVLRLRGRTTLGATFFHVLADYAARLEAAGGRLYLSGLSPELMALARRTGAVADAGPVRLFEATSVLGESTGAAEAAARAWVAANGPADGERSC